MREEMVCSAGYTQRIKHFQTRLTIVLVRPCVGDDDATENVLEHEVLVATSKQD